MVGRRSLSVSVKYSIATTLLIRAAHRVGRSAAPRRGESRTQKSRSGAKASPAGWRRAVDMAKVTSRLGQPDNAKNQSRPGVDANRTKSPTPKGGRRPPGGGERRRQSNFRR